MTIATIFPGCRSDVQQQYFLLPMQLQPINIADRSPVLASDRSRIEEESSRLKLEAQRLSEQLRKTKELLENAGNQ